MNKKAEFLYTNSEQSEEEIKKTSLFTKYNDYEDKFWRQTAWV